MVVFHAGTAKTGNNVVTSGGRVLVATAYAQTLEEAVKAAYTGVDSVIFEGKTYRRDIGHRWVRFSYYYQSPHSLNFLKGLESSKRG